MLVSEAWEFVCHQDYKGSSRSVRFEDAVDECSIISLSGQHGPRGREGLESYFAEHLAGLSEDADPLLQQWDLLLGVGAEDVREEGVRADSRVDPEVGAGYGNSWTGDQRADR